MNILAIDTSLGYASVALAVDGKLKSFSKELEKSKQAENLFFHIEKVFSDANISKNSLNYVVSSIGPGSFTGIRIGMASAVSLSYALKIPFIGISTLSAIANKALKNMGQGENIQNINSLIDAGREEFYFQKFNYAIEEISEAISISYNEVPNIFQNSDLVTCNKNFNFFDEFSKPPQILDLDAKDFLTLTIDKINNKKATLNNKTPLYIRPADAKISNKYNFI